MAKYFIYLSILGLVFAVSITGAQASRAYKVLNNFPADEASCTNGTSYDDGYFVYYCDAGRLEPNYCIAWTDDDGDFVYDYSVYFEVDERITYDMSSALRCEQDPADGCIYQIIEEVTSEVVATSHPCLPGGNSGSYPN